VLESSIRGVMLLLLLLVLGGGNAVLARDLATDLSGAFCPAGGITSVSAPVGMGDSTIALAPAVAEAVSLEFKAVNHLDRKWFLDNVPHHQRERLWRKWG